MPINLPLRIEDLEKPRRPAELFAWCLEKIEEIAATVGGTNALRFGKGLCKPLIEELYPLARWATTSDDVAEDSLLAMKVGSQPFDATVHVPHDTPSDFFVEVTQAHMGQSEYFRMVHLEQHGWAPGPLSGVKREGGRLSTVMQPGRVLGSMAGHIRKTSELIIDSLSKKSDKSYPTPTVLIVAFEDLILKSDETAFDELCRPVEAILRSQPHSFWRVYLVGFAGNLTRRVYP